MLWKGVQRLKDQGIIFITTYDNVDRKLVLRAARELGLKIKIDEENKYALSFDEFKHDDGGEKKNLVRFLINI
ncbi:MAG: hypothetical protein WC242_04705 [Candidatus Paceibacterota bacterium]|jgi:hypothetical protein